MNMTDGELLRRYANDRSESAYEELVRRHIDLVHSAALRQVNGDTQEAEDITQCVFTELARKASKCVGCSSLAGWLYTSTRFHAANARRALSRRRVREQEAHVMNFNLQSTEPESGWAQVRPLLDEAMHTLDDPDREAVLLRHFERRSYAEIGSQLGLTENAARMRVERALEKLQASLAKHGITSTALALAGLLTANAAGAAPAHLAAKVAGAAVAAAGAGGLSLVLAQLFTALRIKLAIALLVAVGIVALVLVNRPASKDAPQELSVVPAVSSVSTTPMPNADSQTETLQITSTQARPTNGSILHLQIVAADSSKPVPLVFISLEGSTPSRWQGEWWPEKKLTANRFGVCAVTYPKNVARLQLSTQVDGFADVRLLWRPDRGEMIPTNYVLRLERPVPIGGRVLDPNGNPVAGARVLWHLGNDPGGVEKVPESHEFTWIETTADDGGRWRVERIAEDMLRRLEGYAKHTNGEYLDANHVFVSWNRRVEKELRDGTHVFKMDRAVTVTGMTVDSAGVPIGEGTVRIGLRNHGGTCEGKTGADGTFSIPGCEPGLQVVCAEAAGYAATSLVADLSTGDRPVRLVLHPGSTLRVRVVDKAGGPVRGANVYLDTPGNQPTETGLTKPFLLEFRAATDSEGRLAWTNAPAGELRFGINAPGFIQASLQQIPADGAEHTVTLASMVVVEGTVRDQFSGQLLPRFRIGVGSPELLNGITNVAWARFDRFWKEFSNGTYRYSCDEPLQRNGDGENRGYILKFEAAGYASQVSRIIRPDDGMVQMDVALRPAANTPVKVFKPDGRLAANADVGLFFPGSPLQLIAGGLSREAGPGGSHLVTDKEGTFELRPDDSVSRVMVVCAEGYAEASPSVLVAHPEMQMQPWGSLEVTGMAAGESGTNYSFEFGNQMLLGTHYARFEDRSKTAAQGVRVFSKLPPGHHKLASWPPGVETPFEIRSGETTKLDLTAIPEKNGSN